MSGINDHRGPGGSAVADRPSRSAPSRVETSEGLSASEETQAGANEGSPLRLSTRRVKDLAFWSRQMLILVRSGMPLADALAAIERQIAPGPFKDVLQAVQRQVEEGRPLTEAMSDHPRFFDAISRGLIAAGESSGQLEQMLDRLAQLTRQQLRLRRSLIGAMVYPALLIVIAVAVVTVMLLFVLPRFTGLFESMEVPLPPTTTFLIGLSDFLRVYWWAVIMAVIGGGVGLKVMMSTNQGRRAVDVWTLKLPKIGAVRASLETSRIARLLGVLLESKVPILEAIQLTREASGSAVYGDLLSRARESVMRGDSLSNSFSRSKYIAPSICEAIHHGERSGQTGAVLTNLADFMDEDNETVVKTLTSILEPVILIILGCVVAFIALSLFVPLFDLTAMAQGG